MKVVVALYRVYLSVTKFKSISDMTKGLGGGLTDGHITWSANDGKCVRMNLTR